MLVIVVVLYLSTTANWNGKIKDKLKIVLTQTATWPTAMQHLDFVFNLRQENCTDVKVR